MTGLTNPVFTEAGEYRFQFSVAGQILGSTSFWVQQVGGLDQPTPEVATEEQP